MCNAILFLLLSGLYFVKKSAQADKPKLVGDSFTEVYHCWDIEKENNAVRLLRKR